MEKVREFLDKVLNKDETVIVACSGGPDSMCLLSLLNEVKDEFNLKIICAHVNHKIRSVSDNEAKMVKEYADANGDIFEYMEITDYTAGKFSEEDARKRRYKFFEELVDKYHATTLFTAHHGDDLIETILMRLTRGSNLNGYIGIRKISKNKEYRLVRPLLLITKAEIIKYLEKKGILYATDESNANDNYTRNRYRHNVIPFLKKENKNVHEKYLKFSEELESYEEFINSYIYSSGFIVDNRIVINKISKESDFIKRKSLELLIKDIQAKDTLEVSDKNIIDLMKLYNLENKSVDLNNNYKGINNYGELMIIKVTENEFKELVIDHDVEINGFSFYYNSCDGTNGNDTIYLDSKEVSLPLRIRPWQEGDKMTIKNLGGTKKISDIFINSKIPKFERNNYPVLVDNKNEILWLPNVKKSQFAKDNNEKYDIIIRCKAR